MIDDHSDLAKMTPNQLVVEKVARERQMQSWIEYKARLSDQKAIDRVMVEIRWLADHLTLIDGLLEHRNA